MSRRRSATGWSAGATVEAFSASLKGSETGAVTVAAGGVAVTEAGAVTVSAGLGSSAFAAEAGSAGFVTSGTVAVVSILKSPMVGGGTLAGSGRGTAASIASSAALARGVVDWAARAEVADTVRKVAATAISTRSNPARFVEQSRIVTPPWAKLPRHGTVARYRWSQLAREAPARSVLSRTLGRYGSNADDTCAPLMQPAPCGTTHDKLTSTARLHSGIAFLPRPPPFVCHRQATVRKLPSV